VKPRLGAVQVDTVFKIGDQVSSCCSVADQASTWQTLPPNSEHKKPQALRFNKQNKTIPVEFNASTGNIYQTVSMAIRNRGILVTWKLTKT
jgi:hypothetical protein